MEEKIVSFAKYNEILEGGSDNLNSECVHYSFTPLEIEHIERLRKTPNIQVSSMQKLCVLLENRGVVQRIPLCANDIAASLDDIEFEKVFLNSKINPYQLSAIATIQHREYRWWSDDIYEQFREIYE